ncbi:uncharacterized protein [Macrobrachium rosenbergii]|uniref:uncharacterized protein n=1 Tax=Macrobrachium rosenbergii TaxID=79674 RepID=UPI0034D46743
MNHTCFLSWFQTQPLANIPAQSLIVLDNAPYHSKISNKAPVSSSKKAEIVSWLTKHNITHDPSFTKCELLDVVKEHKYLQEYETDKIARDAGHKVLRLPPHYCEFNPIELIWAQIKNEVKKCSSNENQTLTNVEHLTKRATDRVTAEDWRSCMCHTREVEDIYRSDIARDHLPEKLIINITSDSGESESGD